MSEIFWDQFSAYLLMGMTGEEYWHGDMRLTRSYREAEKIRRDNNFSSEWRIGHYVFEALLAASPAFREFSKGIDHEYPPIAYGVSSQATEKTKESAEKVKMQKNKAQMEAFAAAFNAKFEDGE